MLPTQIETLSGPKVRVLIVDDHGIVRQGLKMFLAQDPALEIVGEARNGEEAIEQVAACQPNVVLMDLLMPVMDGITATEIINSRYPDTGVIALTSILEDASVSKAVRAGAVGYLLKDTQPEELFQAIHAASAGQVHLTQKATERLLREIRAPESPEKLTERETEVLRMVAMGKANKEIAQELFIGETTVKTHVSNLLAKLNLTSRTQAALHAVRIGLVAESEVGRFVESSN